MDSDANRSNSYYGNNPRIPERGFSGYGGLPHLSGGSLPYSYMYSAITQMYYPTYPYSYSNPSYMGHQPPLWRDSPFSGHPPSGNYPRNMNGLEYPRFSFRDNRHRNQAEVINLESDQEIVKDNVLPANNPSNGRVEIDKNIQVIEIEDNSSIIEQNPKNVAQTGKQKQSGSSKKLTTEIKIDNFEIRKKSKRGKERQRDRQRQKIKQIRKAKKKEAYRGLKQEKEKKKNKQADFFPKHRIRTLNKDLKELKEAKEMKEEKMKEEKIEKKKSEKFSKPNPESSKKKIEDPPVRQIAKYMESHGEIRHGKEFQSLIPELKRSADLEFQRWLAQKRNNVLMRETGTMTY